MVLILTWELVYCQNGKVSPEVSHYQYAKPSQYPRALALPARSSLLSAGSLRIQGAEAFRYRVRKPSDTGCVSLRFLDIGCVSLRFLDIGCVSLSIQGA